MDMDSGGYHTFRRRMHHKSGAAAQSAAKFATCLTGRLPSCSPTAFMPDSVTASPKQSACAVQLTRPRSFCKRVDCCKIRLASLSDCTESIDALGIVVVVGQSTEQPNDKRCNPYSQPVQAATLNCASIVLEGQHLPRSTGSISVQALPPKSSYQSKQTPARMCL